jgi:hypothetical protein
VAATLQTSPNIIKRFFPVGQIAISQIINITTELVQLGGTVGQILTKEKAGPVE